MMEFVDENETVEELEKFLQKIVEDSGYFPVRVVKWCKASYEGWLQGLGEEIEEKNKTIMKIQAERNKLFEDTGVGSEEEILKQKKGGKLFQKIIQDLTKEIQELSKFYEQKKKEILFRKVSKK